MDHYRLNKQNISLQKKYIIFLTCRDYQPYQSTYIALSRGTIHSNIPNEVKVRFDVLLKKKWKKLKIISIKIIIVCILPLHLSFFLVCRPLPQLYAKSV